MMRVVLYCATIATSLIIYTAWIRLWVPCHPAFGNANGIIDMWYFIDVIYNYFIIEYLKNVFFFQLGVLCVKLAVQ